MRLSCGSAIPAKTRQRRPVYGGAFMENGNPRRLYQKRICLTLRSIGRRIGRDSNKPRLLLYNLDGQRSKKGPTRLFDPITGHQLRHTIPRELPKLVARNIRAIARKNPRANDRTCQPGGNGIRPLEL